jgi:hypothetical protein
LTIVLPHFPHSAGEWIVRQASELSTESEIELTGRKQLRCGEGDVGWMEGVSVDLEGKPVISRDAENFEDDASA